VARIKHLRQNAAHLLKIYQLGTANMGEHEWTPPPDSGRWSAGASMVGVERYRRFQ